ncbi:hypothetical protein ACFYTS_03460 [Nocardia sp. NPDC004151]|uniref:hypothetical protein n=1 Tax=Nocardia sp. NPDC004151 TaxID=3364304 RepID=UPI0036B885EE
MPILSTEKGQGKVHNFSVGSSADAVQQFARILRTQDLIESAGTRSIPGLQPVSGKYEDPYAPGGDLGPTFHNPMYKDPETGGWVPGIDPAKVAPTKPEPAQQPAPSSQPQPAQQQQPNSQKPAVQSVQSEAPQLDPNQQQQPETVADVPAGADEHVFGLPDVTGHKEGDTWEEFLPPTPGNSKGIRRVNTIPFGNGTQTVDQVIYNANGTITHSRVVANGLGGFQRWNNESTGAGSYVDKRTAEAPARIQSFEPGSSTSGPPDRESGANRGWTETYGNSYDSDGNLVGTDHGVRNAVGLYNNIHSDLLGNRLITLVNPDGNAGFNSRLAIQIDQSGNGVYVDDKNRQWTVFPDSHGRLGMQRIEVVDAGTHHYQANYLGVVTDEFKPRTGKSEEWYRDTTSVDGFTTRLLADFTEIKYNTHGKEIGRTEPNDDMVWWEKAVLGPVGVFGGLAKAGWTLISYPFKRVVDSMATMSSIQVTDTGLMTTYQAPNREADLIDIAKGSVMPIYGLLKFAGGSLADSMVAIGSMRVTGAGLAATYKPPDRTSELIHNVTGISTEEWSGNPWGSTTATATTVALMFVGPGGRVALPKPESPVSKPPRWVRNSPTFEPPYGSMDRWSLSNAINMGSMLGDSMLRGVRTFGLNLTGDAARILNSAADVILQTNRRSVAAVTANAGAMPAAAGRWNTHSIVGGGGSGGAAPPKTIPQTSNGATRLQLPNYTRPNGVNSVPNVLGDLDRVKFIQPVDPSGHFVKFDLEPNSTYIFYDHGNLKTTIVTKADGSPKYIETWASLRVSGRKHPVYNPILDKPIPNVVYRVNKNFWLRSDKSGRIVEGYHPDIGVTSALNRTRSTSKQSDFNQRRGTAQGTDAGHIFPAEMGSPAELIFYTPQISSVNRGGGAIYKFERRAVTLIKDLTRPNSPGRLEWSMSMEYAEMPAKSGSAPEDGARMPSRYHAGYKPRGDRYWMERPEIDNK